jgi:hypothetical protein
VKTDAEALEEFELVGEPALVERAVRPLDLKAAGADDAGQRQHAAAADAAEEIFGLVHAPALLMRPGDGKRRVRRKGLECG